MFHQRKINDHIPQMKFLVFGLNVDFNVFFSSYQQIFTNTILTILLS